jgi:hypothetical protein
VGNDAIPRKDHFVLKKSRQKNTIRVSLATWPLKRRANALGLCIPCDSLPVRSPNAPPNAAGMSKCERETERKAFLNADMMMIVVPLRASIRSTRSVSPRGSPAVTRDERCVTRPGGKRVAKPPAFCGRHNPHRAVREARGRHGNGKSAFQCFQRTRVLHQEGGAGEGPAGAHRGPATRRQRSERGTSPPGAVCLNPTPNTAYSPCPSEGGSIQNVVLPTPFQEMCFFRVRRRRDGLLTKWPCRDLASYAGRRVGFDSSSTKRGPRLTKDAKGSSHTRLRRGVNRHWHRHERG